MSRICHYRYVPPGLILALLALSLYGQASKRKAVYLTFNKARPVLEALDEILPAELKNKNATELAAAWPNWIARRDADIRSRLALGDEDSLINLLLFGTSFTKEPRITSKEIVELAQIENRTLPATSAASRTLQARVNDLIKGLTTPGTNERLLFARRVLIQRIGHDPRTAAGRAQLPDYLLKGVARVLNEQASYAKALAAARLLGDTTEEFSERSRM